MFTSGWEKDFLKYLNHGETNNKIDERVWGKYKSKAYKIDERIFIVSKHPQGKKEAEHIRAITELIAEYDHH
jgi:uncharacterized protein YifE (UPF0438 family)